MADLTSDDFPFTIEETQLAVPCLSRSPLLSYGIGTAFQCQLAEGHDGQHHFGMKWLGNHLAELGQIEAGWD